MPPDRPETSPRPGHALLRRAATTEAAMWRSMFLWITRRAAGPARDEQAFGYLGVVKPILGVFIGLSVVEIPILDLIIRHVIPWPPARWIMLGISVWGLLWMIGLYASLRIHPHLVGPAGLRVRMGATLDVIVPWADIDTVGQAYRTLPSSRSVQVEQDGGRTVLHVVTGSQTSVDIRFRRPTVVPVPRGPAEPVDELRLYADDPDDLVRACRAALTPEQASPTRP